VLGLSLHGVFDFFHPHFISNAGVPIWWPQFCMAYDLAAAAYLGLTLAANRNASRNPSVLPQER
jgi:hypothetical protein